MSTQNNTDAAVMEKQKTAIKPQRPPKFKVLLINDDFTPFDFVINILIDVFAKTADEAEQLAAQVHHTGKGVCGVFIKDIAELKQTKVMQQARREGHPLQCVLAPDAPSSSPSKGMKP